MTDGTQTEISATTCVLYMALELSASTWLVAFSDGSARKPRRVTVDARELGQLEREIASAREKLRLPADVKVVSCYEAGRDGFWIDRALTKMGVENHIVESSSIEVTRQARRAKTDVIDVGILLRMLIRFQNGERDVWHTVNVPSVEDDDARRTTRERDRLKKEVTALRNRIGGLLATEGLVSEPEDLETFLPTARTPDGREPGPKLKKELLRLHARLLFCLKQLQEIETEQQCLLSKQGSNRTAGMIAQLMCVCGIGMQSAMPLVTEFFAWRKFKNRREVGALAGLTGTPWRSGDGARDQGISKAGNKRIRRLLVELAWLWLRWQPDSAISQWFVRRWGASGARAKKAGIVAVARQLLVALWRLLEHGVVPAGAKLKRSVGVKKAVEDDVRERDAEARARYEASKAPRLESAAVRVAAVA